MHIFKKNNLRRMQMSHILFTVCHPCLQRSTKQVWSWGCVSDDSYHWEAHWQNRHCFISFPVLKRLICPSRREALLPICISIWPCVCILDIFFNLQMFREGLSHFYPGLRVCYLLLVTFVSAAYHLLNKQGHYKTKSFFFF